MINLLKSMNSVTKRRQTNPSPPPKKKKKPTPSQFSLFAPQGLRQNSLENGISDGQIQVISFLTYKSIIVSSYQEEELVFIACYRGSQKTFTLCFSQRGMIRSQVEFRVKDGDVKGATGSFARIGYPPYPEHKSFGSPSASFSIFLPMGLISQPSHV